MIDTRQERTMKKLLQPAPLWGKLSQVMGQLVSCLYHIGVNCNMLTISNFIETFICMMPRQK